MTAIGGAPFSPALTGSSFGIDFNPTVDRIRLVSDADQNLRLHPDTGAVGTDGNLVYAAGDANANANPNVVGSAYTANFNASTTTTLYGIDSNLDILVWQGSVAASPVSPNTGQLFTVGALGVNTTDQVGFDISAPGDVALASLTPQGATTSSLYSINLTTGASTMIGAIGGTDTVCGIAIVTRVETIYAVNTNNQLLLQQRHARHSRFSHNHRVARRRIGFWNRFSTGDRTTVCYDQRQPDLHDQHHFSPGHTCRERSV